ncbi:replication initiation protein [bacterium]|nr:MAG: replication initiation protein [bacterium]
MRTLVILLLIISMNPAASYATDKQSVCYGTAGNGRLDRGVALPSEGANFKSYSNLANFLGRTYVHSAVRDVILGAYRNLETSGNGKVFVYGETGWKEGGSFKPHKTHQNGLSVDFMVPVVDQDNRSVYLPTGALNNYGYSMEFDHEGRYKKYHTDFEAMGAHIVELHKESIKSAFGIRRVIYAPDLQPYLFDTKHGEYLRQHISFSKKPSWVRHDEHYHVDFIMDCEPLSAWKK